MTRALHLRESPFRRLASGLNLALVLTLTALLLGGVALAYGATDNRWYKVIAIQGESMEPTIAEGDLIVITRPERVEVGDIGVFQVDGQVVTHRIVGIDPGGELVTQGDANPTADDWGNAEVRLVGVYRLRVPWLGRVLASRSGRRYLPDGDYEGRGVVRPGRHPPGGGPGTGARPR
jgi:signal peptidase I